MEKLLTIIVPSYNMEMYLPKCLGSLVIDDSQLLNKLDVVIVNDGSKDRTSEIAHEFEKKYSGVFRAIDKANGNYGSCINAALPVAVGRFVKILDADDTFDTTLFKEYLLRLDLLPSSIDMVINDFVQLDEADRIVWSMSYRLPEDAAMTIQDLVVRNADVAMPAVCFRTELVKGLDYRQIEGISYTDTEWFYLPAAVCKEVMYFSLNLYRYFVARQGQTMQYSRWVANRWMMQKVLDKMLGQYDDVGKRGDVNVQYMEKQIVRMVNLLICMNYKDVPLGETRRFFAWLGKLSERYLFVKDWLSEYRMFRSFGSGFKFIEFAVRHPALEMPVIELARIYSRLMAKK